MTTTIDDYGNSDEIKRCSVCGSSITYIDRTKWGVRPHWRYDSTGKPICGKCYSRVKWKIPIGVSCESCKTTETTRTKYGTLWWAKNSERCQTWSTELHVKNTAGPPNVRESTRVAHPRARRQGLPHSLGQSSSTTIRSQRSWAQRSAGHSAMRGPTTEALQEKQGANIFSFLV